MSAGRFRLDTEKHIKQEAGALNVREKIVGMFRGRYAVPVLSSLAELGIVDHILEQGYRVGDFPQLNETTGIKPALDYLLAIGILELADGWYHATTFGRSLLRRCGSASIMESYDAYFSNLTGILAGRLAPDVRFRVNRATNILGSGSLHLRKYFIPGLDLLPSKRFYSLIDLGCGNGAFLRAGAEHLTGLQSVVGVDLAPDAITSATAAFESVLPDVPFKGIVADASLIQTWAEQIRPSDGRELIASWFVVHEFSRGLVSDVVGFFAGVRRHRPHAEMLVGEIVKADASVLAMSPSTSIMPEFLLFHALSGQSPLTWEQWQEVKQNIPYRINADKIFDPIVLPNGLEVPASFIWHLVPS
jgi:SAM-dependent methyltransferase